MDPILKEILGYGDLEIRNHWDEWGALVHPDDAATVAAAADQHIGSESDGEFVRLFVSDNL